MQMNQIARSFPDFCFWIQPCLLCLQRARVAAKHSAKHAHTLPPSPNATPGDPTSQGLTPNVPPSSKYLCFSRQSGVDYSDKIYGRSFQNSPPIRSQCKTVTRVNGLFFFPLPLSFSSDLSSSLETLSSRVSRRRHQVANPHLLSDNDATFPHPFMDLVVVDSEPFEQQLILLRRVRPLSPFRQRGNTVVSLSSTYAKSFMSLCRRLFSLLHQRPERSVIQVVYVGYTYVLQFPWKQLEREVLTVDLSPRKIVSDDVLSRIQDDPTIK